VLVPHLTRTGLLAIYASHAQMAVPLTQTLIALAGQGEHIAVIVADNHFEADEIARNVPDELIKVARGETPHQVRRLVQRLLATRVSYSVVVVIGLLEPFYDEQVKWTVAQRLLTDTLQLLNELARSLCVLVLITPAPKPTRPYLKIQVSRSADRFIELPVLALPENSLQARLF
jgi:hypothetical protein